MSCADGPTCCAPGIADYTDAGSWPQGWQDFEEQAVTSFVGHVGSDGSMPEDRMLAAGYLGTPSLENAGGGYGPRDSGPYSENNARTPEVIVATWMASPGHCKTIMRPNLFNDPAQDPIDEIGVGYTNLNRTHDPDLAIDTMVSHRSWTLVVGASGQ